MKQLITVLVIILIYTIFHLPFYKSYPPVDFGGDESWYINYSVEFLRSGSLKGSIFPLTPANEPSILNPYLYSGLISLIFLIKDAGIDSARLLSLISGLCTVYLTYITGRRFLSREAGILSAIFLGTSIFFSFSHQVRPEALFTLMLLCGYHLLLRYLEEGSHLYLFLCGLITSLTVEVHLNAIIAVVSVVMVYLIFYRQYNRKFRDIIYLIGGFLFTSILWVSINFIPLRRGIDSFTTIHRGYLPAILEGDISEYLDTVFRAFFADFETLFRDFYFNNIPLEFYFFTGLSLFIIYLIYSRHEMKKTIFILMTIISMWLSSVVLSLRVCQPFYIIYFMPSMALLYGWLIYIIYRTAKPFIIKRVVIIVAFITLLLNIYDTLDTGLRLIDAKKNYIDALNTLRDSLPADKRVLGSTNYYHALYGKDTLVNYLFIQNVCPDFKMTLRALKVDYIILDDMLRTLSIMWCGERYYDKIVSFLEANTELIKSIYLEYPNVNGTQGFLREIHIFRVMNIP